MSTFTCRKCGRRTMLAGALSCQWCGAKVRDAPTTSLGFHRVVREAAALLRQLGPKEQEDALVWLSQSLRLRNMLGPEAERSGGVDQSEPNANEHPCPEDTTTDPKPDGGTSGSGSSAE